VIKSIGPKTINSRQIEVNRFQSGQFVDQYSAYTPASIAPGASRYFKVACDHRELVHADYNAYKGKVIGAL
jgi:hypothetical protein